MSIDCPTITLLRLGTSEVRAEIRGLGLKMAKIIKLDLSSGGKKPAENKITGEKLSSFFPGPSEILFYRYVIAILQIRHIFDWDKYLDFSKKYVFFQRRKSRTTSRRQAMPN